MRCGYVAEIGFSFGTLSPGFGAWRVHGICVCARVYLVTLFTERRCVEDARPTMTRASKNSRETARAVEALSPGKRRSTRQSLQRFAYAADDAEGSEDEASGSDIGYDTRSSDGDSASKITSSSLGKRKRDTATTPAKNDIPNGTPSSSGKAATTSNRKPRRQPAKHIKGSNGSVTVEPSLNWEKVYEVTAAMRKRVLAPVDTMGCEALAEEHRSPRDQRLQTLISLMLSSQTKDPVTAAAIENLQKNLPGGLTLESLLEVEPTELNNLISKVGFHNNKTKYIKAAAIILRDKHDSDIPSTIEGLTSLPGVGPKMAYLCMSAAWGRDEGIGVDVHVHRITNLWGWHKTNTPEQTRMELESWLPKEKWHDINHLLVGFGQTICLPVGRKCEECDLGAEKLCPSAQRSKKSPVKKKVKAEVDIKVENGEAEVIKVDQMVVEADDVGVKVEADLQEEGKVELQALGGAAVDVKLEAGAD